MDFSGPTPSSLLYGLLNFFSGPLLRENAVLPFNLCWLQVREAAAALLAFHKKRDEGDKASQALLLNESSEIKIIISVWKIVGKKARTFQV